MSVDNYGQLPSYLMPDPTGPHFTTKPEAVDMSNVLNMSPTAGDLQRKRKRSTNEPAAPKAGTKRSRDGSVSPPLEGKKKNKLGYHRTSVACAHCRRRKIRCIMPENDETGICSNCSRLKKDCYFHPADQSALSRGKSAPAQVRSQQQQQHQQHHPQYTTQNLYSSNPDMGSYGDFGNLSGAPGSIQGMGIYSGAIDPHIQHPQGWNTPPAHETPSYQSSEPSRDSAFHSHLDAFASPSTMSQLTQPYSRSPSFNPVSETSEIDHGVAMTAPTITSHPRADGHLGSEPSPGQIPRSFSYGYNQYQLKPQADQRGRSATLPNFNFTVDSAGSPLSDTYSEPPGMPSASGQMAGSTWPTSPYFTSKASPQQRPPSATSTPGGKRSSAGAPTSHPGNTPRAQQQRRSIPMTHAQQSSQRVGFNPQDVFNSAQQQGQMPPPPTTLASSVPSYVPTTSAGGAADADTQSQFSFTAPNWY